jgi:hypothetical protein
MKYDEDELVDFHVSSRKQGSCFSRLIWLAWIPLLIFAGAVAAYLKMISLRMEFHSVVMIGMIFIIYLLFMKHNAYYAACKFKRKQGVLGAALEKYIDKNLLDIGGVHKANAPFDQFIKNFTTSLRNDNFASVAASVFPTLGILGTFISIALTMPDFSSQDSAQLEQEISQLLGGVGTAFYVSIYGIFLSLWWIFFEKKGMSEFERHVRIIREKTRSFFWTKEEIEQVHFTQSMKNFENLNTLFTKISSNEFIDNLQDTLQERMQMFESIIHQEQKAFQKSTEHFEEIIKLSEKSMQMSEQLFGAYEHIRNKMEDVVYSLESTHKLLRLVNQDLAVREDNLSRTTQLLAKHTEELSRALESVNAEHIEKLYKHVQESLNSMRLESQKVAVAFNRHLNNFDESYTNKLRTSLELIDSETAKIIRQLSSLKDMDG